MLNALNPLWGRRFFVSHPGIGVAILGAGAGADRRRGTVCRYGPLWSPIARAWFILVLPALVLNYFGQGALLLENPEAARNPFYLLAPAQGVDTFGRAGHAGDGDCLPGRDFRSLLLTHQAIQLGYIPRMHIQHTSSAEQGQIYIGAVNWSLMVGVILLVLGFESSGALASAYGVAVTGTMLITSILVSLAVMLLLWKWPPVRPCPC